MKDKPYKVRFRDLKQLWDYERCLFYPDGHESVPCKKRKELDTEWHWMSTPAWYNDWFTPVQNDSVYLRYRVSSGESPNYE